MGQKENGVTIINVDAKSLIREEVLNVMKNGLRLVEVADDTESKVHNGKISLKLLDPYKCVEGGIISVNTKQLIDLAKKNNSHLSIHHLCAILNSQEKIPAEWQNFDIIFPTIVFRGEKGCKYAPLIRYNKNLKKWLILFTHCCDVKLSGNWRLPIVSPRK